MVGIPCIEDGCPSVAVYKSYCMRHRPEPFKYSNRDERLPKDWEQRRRYILMRDKYICYLCGKEGADGVDHKIPNDDNSYDNLAAVHDKVKPNCHRVKTANDVNSQKRLARQNMEAERLRRQRQGRR